MKQSSLDSWLECGSSSTADLAPAPAAGRPLGEDARCPDLERILQERHDLDWLDVRILQALQSDGSLTHKELAEMVGTSTGTSVRRIQKLKERGYIQRVVALINPDLISKGVNVFIEVELTHRTAQSMEAFERFVHEIDDVRQCYQLCGNSTFMLVVNTGSMSSYRALEMKLLQEGSSLESGFRITSLRPHFAMARSKFDTRVF